MGKIFQPAQVLALSFLAVMLIGALLLSLPVSTRTGSIPFIDALFTSTSAVCVTGLVVVDTSDYFTLFGQLVILTLIQLGGLGIMTFSSLLLLVAGGRVSVRDRILVEGGFQPFAPKDFRSLIRMVFSYTAAIELAGCLSLFLRFRKALPPLKALYAAVFHSISAFCNAGLSVFKGNLVSYRGDIAVNVTVMLLIILGGLGFFVLHEAARFFSGFREKKKRLSLHGKLALTVTLMLIFLSAGLIYWMEAGKSMASFSGKEKILASFFQTVTARTAGFNTMDLAALGANSALLLIVLMFIGASPGSTGGGVKTTTVGVIFAFMRSKILARNSASLFRRTVPADVIFRAYTLVSLAIGVVLLAAFILLLNQPELSMQAAIFEVVSAFGTVGLSLGITEKLTVLSKGAIILTMYIGRVGPLTFLYAFSRRKPFGQFAYVEENVMVG